MKKSTLLFMLVGVMSIGGLAGCSQAGSDASSEISWLTDYDAALKQAQATNKLVVIDFYAPWCSYCKRMDKKTFMDSKVQQRLAGFVPLKIDTDKQPELAKKYGVEGLPTMVVIDASGKPLAGGVGYLEPDRYLSILDGAKAKNVETNSVK